MGKKERTGVGIWSRKAYLLRRLARLGMPGWSTRGWDASRGPAVYLIHHQNLFGPVHTLAFLPGEAHLWYLWVFQDRKTCYRQYMDFTFTKRFGWPRPMASLLAFLLSWIVPGLMKAFGGIPVYRGKREIVRTMKLSLEALVRGESILLSPDRNYADRNPEIGPLYAGFLHLEKLYFRETGRHLAFVPVFCGKSRKTVAFGEPLYFAGVRPFRREQEEMAQALREAINRLGRELGDL